MTAGASAGVVVVAACTLALAGCSDASGEAQPAEGPLAGAYAAGRVIDARWVGAADVAGESGVTLRIRDDVLDPVGPVSGDLAPGTSVDLVSPAIDLEPGTRIVAFVARLSDAADEVTYALDPATDAPTPGFDGPLPSGTSQADVLDCMAEVYGTAGAHRRQDALLQDILVPEPERALPGCVARFVP